MTRFAPLAFLLAVVTACTDGPFSPDVDAPPVLDAIVDALNGESADKNMHVFLKPPVVSDPDPVHFGVFDAAILDLLAVDLCRLEAPDLLECETHDGHPEVLTSHDGKTAYTSVDGPGGRTIALDAAAEEYQVGVKLKDYDLSEGDDFRIRIRVGAKILAFVDLRLLVGKAKKKDGSEYYFANENQNVPIKFRVDEGWRGTAVPVPPGQPAKIVITTTTGEEVELNFPSGWNATTSSGAPVPQDVQFLLEEIPPVLAADGDVKCLFQVDLGDSAIGDPASCLRGTTSVGTVFFDPGDEGELLPCLFLTFSQEMLDASDQLDLSGWVLSSVQEDAPGQTLRIYRPVSCQPPVVGMFGDGPVARFAARALDLLRPVLSPLVPSPVQADDIGFGGQLTRFGTIYFWTRAPSSLDLTPDPLELLVGQDVATVLTAVSHNPFGNTDGFSEGEFYQIAYASADPSVATVDGSGVVTGVAPGSTVVTATATRLAGFDGSLLSGSTSVDVVIPADLTVTKTDLVDPVLPGAEVTYTLSVTNDGPGDASALTVVDELPAGVAFVSASGAGWSCVETVADTTITCTRAALASGATSPAITVVVTAPGTPGTLTNNVSVSAVTPETDVGNNAASVQTTVAAGADLAVDLSVSPDPPLEPGAAMSYTIVVDNLGPDAAADVVVEALLPASLVSPSATSEDFTCGPASAGGITCTSPVLAGGATGTIGVTGTAPASPQTLTSSVLVASSTLDPDVDNNGASVDTEVRALVAQLLAPINTVIPQNDPGIGCTLLLENGRGFGYEIPFDWEDVAGATDYEIVAVIDGAQLPLVETVVPSSSELLVTRCNSFTNDNASAEWRVRPIFGEEVGAWSSPEQFNFGPCVLEDGSSCVASTSPIGFGVLPDGTTPTSGQAVSGAFQGLGLNFSIVSGAGAIATPRICDATEWSPDGASENFVVTYDNLSDGSQTTCAPMQIGQLTMVFAPTTRAVQFVLTFDAAGSPVVSARDKLDAVLQPVFSETSFTAQRGTPMTRRIYTIDGDVGRIVVDQPTFPSIPAFIDDVHLVIP